MNSEYDNDYKSNDYYAEHAAKIEEYSDDIDTYKALNTENQPVSSYEYYSPRGNQKPWKRVLLILLGLIIIVIIIFLILKGCASKKISDDDLVKAAKQYYSSESSLPEATGECSTVKLRELLTGNLISKPKTYEKCDKAETNVKVCRLESGSYQYTPFLSCGSTVTEFDPWTIGDEMYLKANKSDVRFYFEGEQKIVGTKYYYPNDEKDSSKVKEYYVFNPNGEYKNKDIEGVEAFKWYIEKTEPIYWNNGAYSATAPDGYPNKGATGNSTTKYSLSYPSEQAGRTIKSVTLYRSRQEAYAYKYMCEDPIVPGTVETTQPCEKRSTSTFKITKEIFYTCDGTSNEVKGKECKEWTSYTQAVCATDSSKGITCESGQGYSYVDQTWKWFKNEVSRTYYPSNSSTAESEKTYYVSSPTEGAIKDDITKTTAYKYYKMVDDTTGSSISDGNVTENWISVTSGYVEEIELISKFKATGFEVNSLSDIINNELTRYKIQLQYRDRK